MSGKIGDYIHWTASGYNKYGIYRKSKEKNRNIDFTAFQNQEVAKAKAVLGSSISDSTITQVQDTLNNFFGNWKNSKLNTKEEKILEAVMEQMSKQFEKTLGNINYFGDITQTEEMKQASISQIRTLANRKDNKLSPQQINNKINLLNELIKKIEASQNNFTEKEKLESVVNSLQMQAKDLYSHLTDPNIMPLATAEELKKETSLKNQINKAIKEYAALPALSLQKGEFFEYLVTYVMGVANGMTIKEINKNLDSLKIGGQNEKIEINTDNFGILDDDNELHSINFDKDVLSIKQSQGKIDVYIDINKDNRYGASLKNIGLSKQHSWIHTVSGSNLLFFLQDMAPNFVNHYLNLNSTHKGNAGKIKEEDKDASRQAMKTVIAVKSITGATYNRKAAQVFIVNDNKTGTVKVLSMQKIVDAINDMAQLSDISVKLNEKSIINANLFVNQSVGPGDTYGVQRISNLLNSLRQIKLSSGISGNFFNQI